MHEIKRPEHTTYWIAYTNNEIFAFDICRPEQQMITGQPYLYQTTDREAWVQTLINDFNTNPDETTNNL